MNSSSYGVAVETPEHEGFEKTFIKGDGTDALG